MSGHRRRFRAQIAAAGERFGDWILAHVVMLLAAALGLTLILVVVSALLFVDRGRIFAETQKADQARLARYTTQNNRYQKASFARRVALDCNSALALLGLNTPAIVGLTPPPEVKAVVASVETERQSLGCKPFVMPVPPAPTPPSPPK